MYVDPRKLRIIGYKKPDLLWPSYRRKKLTWYMQQSSHMTWKLKLLGILSTQSRRYKTKDTQNATIPFYSSCILPLTPLTLLTLAVGREGFVQTCDFYWFPYPILPPLQCLLSGTSAPRWCFPRLFGETSVRLTLPGPNRGESWQRLELFMFPHGTG